jgi:hypothetical protein
MNHAAVLLALVIRAAADGTAPAPAPGDYWSEPKGDYASRQKAFLEFAATAKPGGLYSQVARLELGRGPLNEQAIRDALETLRVRRDGGDFVANALLRMVKYDSPLLSPALRKEIKAALLGFKYWADEPGGKDLLSMWSENHQINYHSAEYLAGQLYPDETFVNNGKTGRAHMETARKRILRWIDTKARTGFNEWDSNNCYINTSAALMNLAELAKDEEVARKAAMMVDVMFFDIAVDSFRGGYGTSHGPHLSRAPSWPAGPPRTPPACSGSPGGWGRWASPTTLRRSTWRPASASASRAPSSWPRRTCRRS